MSIDESMYERLRRALVRSLASELSLRFAGRRVALYPAGRFTAELLAHAAPGGPNLVVLDDHAPRGRSVGDVPVYAPEEVDPASVDAVVIATDTVEATIARRAESWIAGLPEASRPRLIRPCQAITRTLRMASASGDPTVPPVSEPIAALETDSYTVRAFRPRREAGALFRPYQIYPNSPGRAGENLRDECLVTRSEPGLLTPSTRVAVVGSCFASELKRWLVQHGYNFCQYETGPTANCSSLRTGNIFNSASLAQMLDWAYDGFQADEPYWAVGSALSDPYRRDIVWDDARSAEAERSAHFESVRRMLGHAELLIVTLGLSEVWRNRNDGACFAHLPPDDVFDAAKHEHHLLTPDENLRNLERFYARVRRANPSMRLVVTLSPVPMLATFFDRHVAQSNAVSKASLRFAIHMFCERHPEVVYFPSYEIVTTLPENPFISDHRHVEPWVVGRIMQAFVRHYGPASRDRQTIETPALEPRRLVTAG